MSTIKLNGVVLKSTNVLRVTAADFNGKTFDGAPIEIADSPGKGPVPMWLAQAVKDEKILIDSRGCDYACFGVKSRDFLGDVVWAGPGDYLVNLGTDDDVKIHVVCGPFMDMLLKAQ